MGEKQARTSFIQLLLRRKVAHTTSSSLLVILLFTVLSSSLLTTALTYRDRGVRIKSPTTIYAKGDFMKPPRISTRDGEGPFARQKTKSYNRRNSSFLRAVFLHFRIEDSHSFKITITIFDFLKPIIIIKIK